MSDKFQSEILKCGGTVAVKVIGIDFNIKGEPGKHYIK